MKTKKYNKGGSFLESPTPRMFEDGGMKDLRKKQREERKAKRAENRAARKTKRATKRNEREDKRAANKLERLQNRTARIEDRRAKKDAKREAKGQKLIGKMSTTPAERRAARKADREERRTNRRNKRLTKRADRQQKRADKTRGKIKKKETVTKLESKPVEKLETTTTSEPVKSTPVKEKKLSFKEAFRKNRDAGKKTFMWNGKSYHTKTKSETEGIKIDGDQKENMEKENPNLKKGDDAENASTSKTKNKKVKGDVSQKRKGGRR